MENRLTKYLMILALALMPFMLKAAEPVKNLPKELSRFVPEDMYAIAYTEADINGDGKKDAILVVQEKNVALASESENGIYSNEGIDGLRTLLVLQRQNDEKLKLAVSNEDVVLCENCGGALGDPFEPEGKGFTVYHHGGAGWRWRNDYSFGWSRRYQTWQLVKVSMVEYHAGDPDSLKTEEFVPPRDFGLINLAEFHMYDWRNNGKR